MISSEPEPQMPSRPLLLFEQAEHRAQCLVTSHLTGCLHCMKMVYISSPNRILAITYFTIAGLAPRQEQSYSQFPLVYELLLATRVQRLLRKTQPSVLALS